MKRIAAGSGPLADYSVGTKVMTKEGYPGVIDDVLEAPNDLTTYFVTLDGGMGGGQYAEGEIYPITGTQTAASMAAEAGVEHTAADDYPELAGILAERLPPQITTTAAKTAGAWEDNVLAQHTPGCFDGIDEQDSIENYIDAGHPDPWSFPLGSAEFEQAYSDFQAFHKASAAILLDSYPERCTCAGRTASQGSADAAPFSWGVTSSDLRASILAAQQSVEDSFISSEALYLPLNGSTEPVVPQQADLTPGEQTGYAEGYAQGQKGVTREPSNPLDPEYVAGFDRGWADGVLVMRQPANTFTDSDIGSDQVAGLTPEPIAMQAAQTEAGLWDLIQGNPTPSKNWKSPTDRYSYDWCRFRRMSHCWLSKTLDEAASKEAGYAVWTPEDRGYCSRMKWPAQQNCPTGAPGPHVSGGLTDATIPWEQGGQHGGTPSGMYRADVDATPKTSTLLGMPRLRTEASGQQVLYRGIVVPESDLDDLVSNATPAGRFWSSDPEPTDIYSRPDQVSRLRPGLVPVRLIGTPKSAPDHAPNGDQYEWAWDAPDQVHVTGAEVWRDGAWQPFSREASLRTTATNYGDDVIMRGLSWNIPDGDRGRALAEKVANHTISAAEIVHALQPLGIWWGITEQYGGLEAYESHAESGFGEDVSAVGSLAEAKEEEAYWAAKDPNVPDHGWVAGVPAWKDRLRHYQEGRWFGCTVPVILVAKRPINPATKKPWDPDTDNPSSGIGMGNSYLPTGTSLDIIEVRYEASLDSGWTSLSAQGIRSTAGIVAVQQRPSPDPVTYSHTPPTRSPLSDPDDRNGGFHVITAKENGKQVGYLHWFDPENGPWAWKGAYVEKVEVASDHRRQGLASEMMRRAREITPGVKHSTDLTGDGRAWRNGESPSESGIAATPRSMRPRLGGIDDTEQEVSGIDLAPLSVNGVHAAQGGYWHFWAPATRGNEIFNYYVSADVDRPKALTKAKMSYGETYGRLVPTGSPMKSERVEDLPDGAQDSSWGGFQAMSSASQQVPHTLTTLDSLNPTGSVFVDYDPHSRATAPLGPDLTTLAETQGMTPSAHVRIYRGAPSIQSTIVPGDFVTTNRQLAQDYAGNGVVLSLDTTYGDVLDSRSEPGGEEYLYRPSHTASQQVPHTLDLW